MLPPTNHCKICFKEIEISDFCRFFDRKTCICQSCQRKIAPKFISFAVNGYKALAVYEYSEFIKNLIYLFKGCSDYEMKDVFLNLFIKELKILYKDYKIIPIPSYKGDDENRGFNHVTEIFNNFNQNILHVLDKTKQFKQASKGAKKRKQIHKYLRLNTLESLANFKVLIVDDIYTTGSTMKAAINLVEKLNPKQIKVLVLAKTKPKEERKI